LLNEKKIYISIHSKNSCACSIKCLLISSVILLLMFYKAVTVLFPPLASRVKQFQIHWNYKVYLLLNIICMMICIFLKSGFSYRLIIRFYCRYSMNYYYIFFTLSWTFYTHWQKLYFATNIHRFLRKNVHAVIDIKKFA